MTKRPSALIERLVVARPKRTHQPAPLFGSKYPAPKHSGSRSQSIWHLATTAKRRLAFSNPYAPVHSVVPSSRSRTNDPTQLLAAKVWARINTTKLPAVGTDRADVATVIRRLLLTADRRTLGGAGHPVADESVWNVIGISGHQIGRVRSERDEATICADGGAGRGRTEAATIPIPLNLIAADAHPLRRAVQPVADKNVRNPVRVRRGRGCRRASRMQRSARHR